MNLKELIEKRAAAWEGTSHYTRVIYRTDMQVSEERKCAGKCTVTILYEGEGNGEIDTAVVKETEQAFRECLEYRLLNPGEGNLYSLTWYGTEAVTKEQENGKQIIGSQVTFDIHEYACQETTNPDPIMAMNQYIKEQNPQYLVIGMDQMDEITELSQNQTIIFCQLVSMEKAEETNAAAWVDSKIMIYLFDTDSARRLKTAAAIANQMTLDGEIIMLDQSPMSIKQLQADYQSDYLKKGQILVTVHYGLLRYREKPHILQSVSCRY
ncbi:MAG: hypothetical protein HFI75_03710 [Lachnospiraceae bacterium]|nr:hypothetical protein [Lachnospiraceae bacterium]